MEYKKSQRGERDQKFWISNGRWVEPVSGGASFSTADNATFDYFPSLTLGYWCLQALSVNDLLFLCVRVKVRQELGLRSWQQYQAGLFLWSGIRHVVVFHIRQLRTFLLVWRRPHPWRKRVAGGWTTLHCLCDGHGKWFFYPLFNDTWKLEEIFHSFFPEFSFGF